MRGTQSPVLFEQLFQALLLGLADVDIREGEVHPQLVPAHLQHRRQAARHRRHAPLDVLRPSPAHRGDQQDVVEEEEATVLPYPGGGAGRDEILSEKNSTGSRQVVVTQTVDQHLKLPKHQKGLYFVFVDTCPSI